MTLVIRDAQIQVFRARARNAFIEQMAAQLRRDYPARFTAPGAGQLTAEWDEAIAFVRTALAPAITLNLTSERCCNLYIRLLLQLGARQGDDPLPDAIAVVLARHGMAPEERLAQAYELAERKPARPGQRVLNLPEPGPV